HLRLDDPLEVVEGRADLLAAAGGQPRQDALPVLLAKPLPGNPRVHLVGAAHQFGFELPLELLRRAASRLARPTTLAPAGAVGLVPAHIEADGLAAVLLDLVRVLEDPGVAAHGAFLSRKNAAPRPGLRVRARGRGKGFR